MEHPPFAVTVDLVVLTIRDDELCVLLVRRGEAPYAGRWALPGGFVRPDEDLDAAAARELAEETGVRPADVHVEQLASYGAPRRDPRMRVVTVAYLALAPSLPSPIAGTDAAEARWTPVERVRRIAFDHDRILTDGIARARAKLEYAPVATAFCAPEFTVAELRRVYEIVWGVPLDPRNFHRKVTGVPGLLAPAGTTTTRNGGRPAELYRRGPAELLLPPILRG
ncbi:8-oxo-dGTP diphosphatase [Jatrophihabitans endophyticus]|uniref:8-oxo-dGTP diphosphatase n=1 Tax=Jatrophihabitans endophyticus TaxID=1206085 RepID=A0A1M5RGE2_9ACTN|nr:NUDIX domain-containing protein [Jatrophihabitans endophyticus]SHH25258.1 8-oxo-dGTP diphosphatase [Jatrophihabitans endophyticus]